jgi:exodeoxyribonuclease VII large subunit
LHASRARLLTRQQRSQALIRARLRAQRTQLAQLNERLARTDPRVLLAARRRTLSQLQGRLLGLGHALCHPQRQQLAGLAGQLTALSPLASLSRGYAIVLHQDTGRALLRAQDASPGDTLQIRLHSGTLRARVEQT